MVLLHFTVQIYCGTLQPQRAGVAKQRKTAKAPMGVLITGSHFLSTISLSHAMRPGLKSAIFGWQND